MGDEGLYLPWQAISIGLFLLGHLGTAIWFASGVKKDVAAMKVQLEKVANTIAMVVKEATRHDELIGYLRAEVDRLRDVRESNERA